jgi:chromosome segregation ATPase
MTSSARVFLATFAPTAAGVGALVLNGRPTEALVTGVAGLVLHWLLTLRPHHDGELADASYFFGFLLTLIFLAAGLVSLGSAVATGPAVVVGFLKDLGAGLVLTIVGLLMRQMRTLSAVERTAPTPNDSLTEAQRDLAQAMRVLIRALDVRPQEVAARELSDAREKAREATEGLERNVVLAAERIDNSMQRLEQTTITVTSALVRASSGLGDALTTNVERIQIEVAAALSVLESQRKQIEESVRLARATSETTQRQLAEQMQSHVGALTSLSTASSAFGELAEQVKREVQALPNPGERLVGLWDGVRSLETTLTESIGGATEQLAALSRRTNELSAALARLERSTGTAAETIEHGGVELGDALRRELSQMNQVLDEYTRLFERNLGALQ